MARVRIRKGLWWLREEDEDEKDSKKDSSSSKKNKNSDDTFDMSKFDQLENLIADARKDLQRTPNSVEPKEYQALILKKIKKTLEELISSEGLEDLVNDDSLVADGEDFESDMPANPFGPDESTPDVEPDLGATTGDTSQETPPLDQTTGTQSTGGPSLDALFGPSSSGTPQKNTAPNANMPSQESFTRLAQKMYPSVYSSNRLTAQEALDIMSRYRLKEADQQSGTDAISILAAMINPDAVKNKTYVALGKELYNAAMKNGGISEDILLPILRKANTSITREFLFDPSVLENSPGLLKNLKGANVDGKPIKTLHDLAVYSFQKAKERRGVKGEGLYKDDSFKNKKAETQESESKRRKNLSRKRVYF